ncbi:Protein CBG25461 [Caenorhabditis briggsae]|uniref:Protein CBG25461 n=1 Tax=Caenorhabditis briggsae TaxID=6238 RepID=B6ILH6_CAEBR|nr:Protein CBG25461 [Caenorhabditis briggsae]CAS00756.1 Protein CBG25461 [Caenorhabditis briggsae]
MTMRDDVEDEQ